MPQEPVALAPSTTDADEVPCPVVTTDRQGRMLAVNASFLSMAGGDRSTWLQQSMDAFTPMASRIFLQTHVWPMLLRDGQVREIRLQMLNGDKVAVPVLVNCQRKTFNGADAYSWVLFVTHERTRYEAELLEARRRADALASRYARGELFLRTVTDAVPNLIAYWDRDLLCRFANNNYLQWFDKTAVEMQGIHIRALLGDALFALNEPCIQAALRGQSQEFEREIVKPDGSVGCTLVHYEPDLDPSGTALGFYAVVTNVTRMKEADAAIRLSASVFNAASEGIMVTDASGALVSVNPSFVRITGYAEEEVLGQNPRMLQSGQHGADFYADMWRALLSHGEWNGDLWCKRKNGAMYLEALSITSIRDSSNQVVRYVGVFSDITERHNREEQIRHMALHDGLTELPNRVLMMERLNQLLELSAREPRPVAVLFLDLDGFKAVNDQFGHEAGDAVLRAVAVRLKELIRTSDTVARLGGDEFVILLHNPESYGSVIQVAERVISAINAPITVANQIAQVGTSIGIAVHPEHGVTSDQLLTQADSAMYQAKRSGKNTFRFSE